MKQIRFQIGCSTSQWLWENVETVRFLAVDNWLFVVSFEQFLQGLGQVLVDQVRPKQPILDGQGARYPWRRWRGADEDGGIVRGGGGLNEATSTAASSRQLSYANHGCHPGATRTLKLYCHPSSDY